ncbi:enoyl-CoA hydratase/isomerase family protein [Gordonia neofelifaecis]|uniref:Enoyl-CoA hydratase n=1 Tax=Gordonia neofelifaecis NRRL B-59395 TaxID=644548 RepID=F1YFS5_9ACTN|nr:enoyl-CoA hydratase/isomerase family protein [Gordonia neofelifaecis]EGD56502.1 enoyl-CoA hydratase [Gordonia neofelifaecis NRRL B-59395]
MPEALAEIGSDGVGVLTLNRPDRLNAVTASAVKELTARVRELGDDPNCRAVVLTGAGRAFCAGLDLRDGLGVVDADPVRGAYTGMRQVVDAVIALREIPQPVIAAVRGAAGGAGFALAAASDFRYCSPDARFGAPFVALGVSAGDLGLSWMLPRLIGSGDAAELLYTAGELDADDAMAHGLVQKIADDPLAAARARAAEIAAQPALAVQLTKKLLDASVRGTGYREHLESELRAQVIGLSSADHLTAVDGFSRR